MRRTSFKTRLAVVLPGRRGAITVAAIVLVAAAAAVWALLPPPAGGRAVAEVPLPPPGADASWPSCTHPSRYPLPTSPSFAIVGINDGEPGTSNPCLSRELAWAATATGGTTQPGLAYYVMAADPFSPYERKWTKPIWPTSAVYRGVRVAVPAHFGTTCTGSHTSAACAFVFGWSAAYRDAHLPGLRAPSTTRYWIDVEAPRDWSVNPTFNEAIVEGMAAYFTTPVEQGGLGTTAGLYSTAELWEQIVGDARTGSPLPHLDEWTSIGTGTEIEAAAAFTDPLPFLAGARVTMVQYWVGTVGVGTVGVDPIGASTADFDYAPG